MRSESTTPGFFALPTRGEFRAACAMAVVFLFFFYAFYGAAAWLAELLEYRFRVGFDFEHRIPFVPSMAAVYLSVGPMMLLSVFIVRDTAQMRLLLKVLCVQTLAGFCVFLAFPVESSFPSMADPGDLPLVYRIADLANLKNNELPSLHLCFAATMAFVYGSKSGPLGSNLFHLWALAIAASTLLLHEHNLLDLVAGYLLAWCGARWWLHAVARERAEKFLSTDLRLSDEPGS